MNGRCGKINFRSICCQKPPGCKMKARCVRRPLIAKVGWDFKTCLSPPRIRGSVRRRINTPFNYCSFFSLPLRAVNQASWPRDKSGAIIIAWDLAPLTNKSKRRRELSSFMRRARKRASQFRSRLIPFFANISPWCKKPAPVTTHSGNSLNRI